jgi:two-component system nitrogen regulation sensor histidine kinase NtrY
MFTLVTIIPTIIVAVFSTMFFNFGIQSWFDERVSKALDESVAVAQAYLEEHRANIRGDAFAMANDVDHELAFGLLERDQLNSLIDAQTRVRLLSEAVVMNKGRIIAQSQLSFSLAFERIPDDVIERAENGEAVVMIEGKDKVRALVKLKSLPEAYLLVGRFVDSKVVEHVESAEGGVKEYRRLKENISALQIEFVIVFVLLALLLLFAAVWYGMLFATRLAGPISNLVGATERVRGGDFSARVVEGHKDDEVSSLARAFNRMTDELDKQRNDLMESNRQSDARRRLIETVLSGVSAGVVSLSHDKVVLIANPVAASLLQLPQDITLKGFSILDIVPEFSELLKQAEEKPSLPSQGDVTIIRNEKSHMLHVRVALERVQEAVYGYIITFDDITDLLVAQRSAAWADVARRVAHEIKNPLTPIQLSAERLRKKFLPASQEDSSCAM